MPARTSPGALVAALALVLSGTGCGSSIFGPDPVEWTDQVCASLVPLAQANQNRPAVDPTDPAATQRAMSASLAAAADAARSVLAGLDEAGPSPIAGGDEVAGKLRDLTDQLRATMLDTKIKLDATDPAASTAFITVLAEALAARAALATGVEQVRPAVEANPEVRAAARSAASCRQFGLGEVAVGSSGAAPSGTPSSAAPPSVPPSR